MNAMYFARFMLKGGYVIEGHINEYTREYLDTRLNKFTLNKSLSFDLYDREAKSDGSTVGKLYIGWKHLCYVRIKKQNIMAFTYSHVKS